LGPSDERGRGKNQAVWQKWSVYLIRRKDNGHSSLQSAPPELIKFNSEYHYLFSTLYDFDATDDPGFEYIMSLPNIARRFLEGFCGTMIPTQDDLDIKLHRMLRPEEVVKVLKFLHRYSHHRSTDRSLVIPEMSECKEVIAACLNAVKTWNPVLRRADEGDGELFSRWRREALSATCRLDYAVVALAQHYGIPTHGLDVTTNFNVALWFATNLYTRDDQGVASYASLRPNEWPVEREHWPVLVVCQMVTNSIEQSLHDCEELAEFGLEAKRPLRQHARFFQGGHSYHQNRLAEAVVCVVRLAPGAYETNLSFDSLFPRPENDPAYDVI
jgi:hypothetical protein